MVKSIAQIMFVLCITACTQKAETICSQYYTDGIPSQFSALLSMALPDQEEAIYIQCDDTALLLSSSNSGSLVALSIGDDVIMHENDQYSINIGASKVNDSSVRVSKNRDTIYDRIVYSILNSNGDAIGDAVDFTRDGNIDMRTYSNTKKVDVYVKGEWRELIEHNNKDAVLIDDEPVFVKVLEGKWVVY